MQATGAETFDIWPIVQMLVTGLVTMLGILFGFIIKAHRERIKDIEIIMGKRGEKVIAMDRLLAEQIAAGPVRHQETHRLCQEEFLGKDMGEVIINNMNVQISEVKADIRGIQESVQSLTIAVNGFINTRG